MGNEIELRLSFELMMFVFGKWHSIICIIFAARARTSYRASLVYSNFPFIECGSRRNVFVCQFISGGKKDEARMIRQEVVNMSDSESE